MHSAASCELRTEGRRHGTPSPGPPRLKKTPVRSTLSPKGERAGGAEWGVHATDNLLLTIYNSLFTIHHSPFTIHHSLFIILREGLPPNEFI
jgi:hypothetical protein